MKTAMVIAIDNVEAVVIYRGHVWKYRPVFATDTHWAGELESECGAVYHVEQAFAYANEREIVQCALATISFC